MHPGSVVIRYNPARWAEINLGHNHEPPSKFVSFSYGANRSGQLQHAPRKRHLLPLSSSSFERPVEESLANLAQYAQKMKLGETPVHEVETEWYYDVTNVAQRLKFLRDTFKVIQSVRKRKIMGERADFRTVYDSKMSCKGSPSLLDEDLRTGFLSEDEDRSGLRSAANATPLSRRGRPRKRRGRERRAPVCRGDAAINPLKRTRASKRLLDAPPLPAEDAKSNGSTETLEAHADGDTKSGLVLMQKPAFRIVSKTASKAGSRAGPASEYTGHSPAVAPPRRRGRPAARQPAEIRSAIRPEISYTEPQGPPLMYLPPILPSQRLSLMQNIPPYRNLASTAYNPSPSSTPYPGKAEQHPNKVRLYLPSQVTFLVLQYPSSPGPIPSYLPSQSLLEGVIPFQFPNYQPPPGKTTLKGGISVQTRYPSGYAPPLNYGNYPASSYSSGANGASITGNTRNAIWPNPTSYNGTQPFLPAPTTGNDKLKVDLQRKPAFNASDARAKSGYCIAKTETAYNPATGAPAKSMSYSTNPQPNPGFNSASESTDSKTQSAYDLSYSQAKIACSTSDSHARPSHNPANTQGNSSIHSTTSEENTAYFQGRNTFLPADSQGKASYTPADPQARTTYTPSNPPARASHDPDNSQSGTTYNPANTQATSSHDSANRLAKSPYLSTVPPAKNTYNPSNTPVKTPYIPLNVHTHAEHRSSGSQSESLFAPINFNVNGAFGSPNQTADSQQGNTYTTMGPHRERAIYDPTNLQGNSATPTHPQMKNTYTVQDSHGKSPYGSKSSNMQRGQTHPHVSPQPAPSLLQYNAWTTPLTETLGMELPGLKALENDIKPLPSFDGQGSKLTE